MPQQIFINLAVSSLEKSQALYEAMGFTNNPQFSDETAKCMVWCENIFLMIMTRDKFEGFATKPLADTKSGLAALYSLSLDSVDAMNVMMAKGLAAGGIEPHAMRDFGFMQQRTLEDFDGHSWELFFMDVSKFPSNG
jgi:uncharacterized protein